MDTFDNGNKAITVNVHRFDSCKSNSICRPKTLKVFDKGIMLDGKIYAHPQSHSCAILPPLRNICWF